MNILIDARLYGPRHTGIGIYTKNLIDNLAQIDQKNHYLILHRSDSQLAPLPSNFAPILADIPPYSLAEQVKLPLLISRHSPDLVHYPSISAPLFSPRPFILTVHDLIKHHSRGPATTTRAPALYYLKFLAYLLVFSWITRAARKIIVPSQSVADELNLPYKTRVTHEGFSLNTSRQRKIVHFPQNYALYVGNSYPHKNLEFLISSWSQIFDSTQTNLVIVTSRGVFRSRLEALINKHQASSVLLSDHLENDELAWAYSHARLYVTASLMEGFNLGGLDALGFSLPLLCSDIPVHHEIYRDSALYFSPQDPKDFVYQALRLLKDAALRQDLISRGKIRSKDFSWFKMAKETLAVYESCSRLRSH